MRDKRQGASSPDSGSLLCDIFLDLFMFYLGGQQLFMYTFALDTTIVYVSEGLDKPGITKLSVTLLIFAQLLRNEPE
ncbi:pre-mrna-splicing factor syf1 [Echinococcus multilocularis]|uniref:Pre-mrna-splicing factor syf1 n=1 Tax=Echinococcus multilocularis TaxID=6211 RepID=A0A0S4MMY5_ECHMU|nr:pre-mrna-splicing factor syf1 [Echinococcus multilocularis]